MNNTDYVFTDRERLYFERLQQAFNQQLGSSISLIVTQQDLQGQWRMKQDGSGLERADLAPAIAPQAVLDQLEKKAVNGVA